jgi:AcrR family transcriptional regulator
MDGFARRKEQNKIRIINAAETLFNQYGIEKISVDEIARQAGVSKVTIYHLFRNKDGLIFSYFEKIGDGFIQLLNDLLHKDQPYMDKLEAIFQYAIKAQEKRPRFDIECDKNPELQQLRDRLLQQERDIMLQLINEGKKGGYLNPDLSIDAIEIYIEIISTGVKDNRSLHEKFRNDKKQLHDLLLIMLYGFAKIK